MAKISASIAAFAFGATALAGCGGADSSKSAAAPWTADHKAGVRQLLAMAYQGQELDCAVGVITDTYSTEDWAFAAAHITFEGQATTTTAPPRIAALEDRSRKTLERRCGIKDTRAEDQARDAAAREWDVAVDEWSALTEKRDAAGAKTVVVDGRTFEDYDAWATANGRPLNAPD